MSEKQARKMSLGVIAAWVFGSLFALNAVVCAFVAPVAAGVYFVMAVILLPPGSRILERKFHLVLSGRLKFFIIFLLMMIAVAVSPKDLSARLDGLMNSGVEQKAIEAD